MTENRDTSPSAKDQWLVRTALNELVGPMSREDLITQIREGKLGPQDEVCQANSYWIYLEEVDEVKRQLGIELPRGQKSGQEEPTETDLKTMTQELKVPEASDDTDEDIDLPELIPSHGGQADDEDGTKVLSMRGGRRPEVRHARQDRRGGAYRRGSGPHGQMKPLILGNVERPSFWRFVVSGLIILTGILVAWVIRVLQTAH